MSKDIILTKPVVLNTHKNQLQNGENNDEELQELATILGGIDAILATYLSNKAIELNDSQLNRINDIITGSQHAHPLKHTDRANQIKIRNDVEDYNKVYLELDSTDTCLHDLLGDDIAQKILHFLYHSITFTVLIISAIVWVVLATPYFTDLVYPIVLIILCCGLWIPYTILMLLIMNRQAAKMVIKSFEFWLKLVYGIIYFVSTYIDLYGVNMDIFKDGDIRVMMIADVIFLALCVPLFIIVVSFWDAFNGVRKWKVGLTGFIAFEFTLYAGYLQYLLYINSDNQVSDYWLSIRITSLKILSIFLWKHCVYALMTKGKAISVRRFPYLIWNSNDTTSIGDIDDLNAQTSTVTVDSEFNIPALACVNTDKIKPLPARQTDHQLSDDELEQRYGLYVSTKV